MISRIFPGSTMESDHSVVIHPHHAWFSVATPSRWGCGEYSNRPITHYQSTRTIQKTE